MKSKKRNSSLSDDYTSSSSDDVAFNKEIENDKTKETYHSGSDDNDLNFWLWLKMILWLISLFKNILTKNWKKNNQIAMITIILF